MKKTILPLLVAVGLICSASATTITDTFGTGANQFTIDFTTIGNPGNAADTTGYGAVGYSYRIGTYDISQNQLQAAASASGQNFGGGAWSGDQPAANVSWYQAAAFVNWLDTSTGHQAAYNLTYTNGSWSMDLWHSWDAGYDPNNLYRNKNAVYVLPSEDEFYKAAYGKNDGSGYTLYSTGSDTAPNAVASGTTSGTAVYNQTSSQGPASVYLAGGLSSWGTIGQGGNVYQLLESSFNGINSGPNDDHTIRGGFWGGEAYRMESSTRYGLIGADFGPGLANNPLGPLGFRVASVIPEPSTYALLGIGAIGMLMVVRKKKTA
jgi:formylglycine-generating enzyme required for sulfatase activity